MALVLDLKDVRTADLPEVGGKAARLAEISRAGLPVPKAFVITAEAFSAFLSSNKLDRLISETLESIDISEPDDIREKSKLISEAIIEAKLPEKLKREMGDSYGKIGISRGMQELSKEQLDVIHAQRGNVPVTVRTSVYTEEKSALSIEGLHSQFIYVTGLKGLSDKIKSCWASTFSEAVIYARKAQASGDVKLAVIVQAMVDADRSGAAASVNPVTSDPNEIVIESSLGMGLTRSGTITPDIIAVNKQSERVTAKKVGIKEWRLIKHAVSGDVVKERVSPDEAGAPSMSSEDVSAIVQMVKQTENTMGVPVILEWAAKRDRIYFLGATPIKLGSRTAVTSGANSGALLRGLAASPGTASGVAVTGGTPTEHEKTVLITKSIPSSELTKIASSAAVVSEEGGVLSHAAQSCRELGIPLIVGAKDAATTIQLGAMITVDGLYGEVRPYAGETLAEEAAEGLAAGAEAEDQQLLLMKAQESGLKEGQMVTATKTRLLVTSASSVEQLAELHDGVGLFPAEVLLMGLGRHPEVVISEGRGEDLYNHLLSRLGYLAEKAHPKPVAYRMMTATSADLRKLPGGEAEPQEENPLMGRRGVRRILASPGLFKTELRALAEIRSKGFDNISILIPFVQHPSEVERVKQLMAESGVHDLQLGVNIDAPASSLMIDELASSGITSANIDTDELAEHVTAADPHNENVRGAYSPVHPAVLKLLEKVVSDCKRNKIAVSVSGRITENNDMIDKLVHLGVDAIVVTPDQANLVKYVTARSERRLLLDIMRAKNRGYEGI